MRAGALADFPVGVEQCIGLARERSNLVREGASQPFRRAGADGGKRFRDALERSQSEADLEQRREEKHDGQRPEGDGERLVERPDLLVDLGWIAGDRDEIPALLAEIDRAFDETQPLVLRPADIAPARPVIARGNANVLKMRQAAVPKRARGAYVGSRSIQPRPPPLPTRHR